MNTSKALLCATALVALAGTTANADGFPERPIEIIVPYAAGGATDVFARAIARAMSEALPNTPNVVVINVPGGAATIGLTQVANAQPDGYTIVYTTSSPIALQPLYGRTTYTVEDFAPVAHASVIPAAFNVHMDSDIRTVEDLVAWANANPGQFTYASTGGNGSGTHIVSEQFAAALGIQMRHIPFEGTAPLTAALMGGQVMGTMQMPDMHTGGEVRPVVFLTPMRPSDPVYDEIPTSLELGIPAVANFFTGFLAPAGTPSERLDILSAAIAEALEDPTVRELHENANYPISYADPEAFGEILAETIASNRAELVRMGLIDE